MPAAGWLLCDVADLVCCCVALLQALHQVYSAQAALHKVYYKIQMKIESTTKYLESLWCTVVMRIEDLMAPFVNFFGLVYVKAGSLYNNAKSLWTVCKAWVLIVALQVSTG